MAIPVVLWLEVHV